MPMHGNDVIAIEQKGGSVRILKGESKSAGTVSEATMKGAAEGLDRDDGRPNPSTLAFIAKRLYEAGRDVEGKVFEDLQANGAIAAKDVQHLIFTFAGKARSYSMLPPSALDKNLASSERALAFLLRRDLLALRELILSWLGRAEHSDEAVAQRLANADDEFGPEDAVVLALTTTYFRALGLADTALLTGERARYEAAIGALAKLIAASGDVGNVPIWWVATLTIHLLRDLWDQCLHIQLPDDGGPSGDLPNRWADLRRDFIAQLAVRRPPHIDLWPSQLEAAQRSVDTTDDLVIALPTSAGKTKIAELCILRTLADEKRVVYVTPLRALSAQVERVLARTFAPLGAAPADPDICPTAR